MTPYCTTCGRPMIFDAYGRSACGHAAPPPGYAPAPPPAWGQPAWGQQPGQPAWGYQPGQPAWGYRAAPKKGCCLGRAAVLALLAVTVLLGAWLLSGPSSPGSAIPGAAAPLAGSSTVGAATSLAAKTVAPGDSAVITTPAVSITVPAGAYASGAAFKVSSAPLTVRGYDGLVTAISPLVIIENGGLIAASPVELVFPVTVPAGSFAMGFYRHDDGTLEPVPLLAESAASVTIATRHFSALFIALVAEAALPSDIGTGFRAGTDDFSFANYGTYASPGGQCAGQSLAAMWYFAERRAAGAPALYRRFDNNGRTPGTPDFWQDDSLGWRLASSVHEDLDWETLSGTVELALEKAKVDRLQWNAFRYAMLVTGAPQFVGLSEGDQAGGHVVVAYAATATGLWVADPNFPGQLRDIPWDAAAKEFRPYGSGATAAESDANYDRIAFYGKTALVDWAGIGARWAQAEAGSVGGRRFSGSSLMVYLERPDGSLDWSPLADGTVLPTTQARLGFFSTDKSATLRATLYVGTVPLANLAAMIPATVALPPGRSDIGVFVEGFRDGDWRAVDFIRLAVTVPGSTPVPDPTDTPEPATPEPTPEESAFDCTGTPPPGTVGRLDWMMHCQSFAPAP